jgi:hypothetical protein
MQQGFIGVPLRGWEQADAGLSVKFQGYLLCGQHAAGLQAQSSAIPPCEYVRHYQLVQHMALLTMQHSLLVAELDGQTKDANTLVLTEGTVLGGGAFSRVSIVTGGAGGRDLLACASSMMCPALLGAAAEMCTPPHECWC